MITIVLWSLSNFNNLSKKWKKSNDTHKTTYVYINGGNCLGFLGRFICFSYTFKIDWWFRLFYYSLFTFLGRLWLGIPKPPLFWSMVYIVYVYWSNNKFYIEMQLVNGEFVTTHFLNYRYLNLNYTCI